MSTYDPESKSVAAYVAIVSGLTVLGAVTATLATIALSLSH